MQNTIKWLGALRERVEQQPFYKENFEESLQTFTKEALLKNETLQETLGLKPSDLELIYKHGYALYVKERFGESEELFRLLVILNATVEKYWIAHGLSLQYQKRYDEAIKSYGVAALLGKENPASYLYAAECFAILGRKQEATRAKEVAKKMERQ